MRCACSDSLSGCVSLCVCVSSSVCCCVPQQDHQGGSSSSRSNKFDAKTDKGSADLYFHYYGMLQHQQNMLQDVTRTGTYHAAITENRADFEGKVVMDVGAGSGILSLFATQVGVEASRCVCCPAPNSKKSVSVGSDYPRQGAA